MCVVCVSYGQGHVWWWLSPTQPWPQEESSLDPQTAQLWHCFPWTTLWFMLTAPSLHLDISEPCLLSPTHYFHSTRGGHCTHSSFHRQTAHRTLKTNTQRQRRVTALWSPCDVGKVLLSPQAEGRHSFWAQRVHEVPLFQASGKVGETKEQGHGRVWRQGEEANKWSCLYNKEQQDRQTYRLSPSRTLGNTGEEGGE